MIADLIRFNPCFNGILSSINYVTIQGKPSKCFNPCFNGILSSIRGVDRWRLTVLGEFQSLF